MDKIPIEQREPAIALWRDNHFVGVSELEMARFGRAFHCSASYHTDTVRKSGESYYRHDCRVASRILNAGFPIDLATDALLHEFIEDDGWTIEQIARDFGEESAFVVDSVSKGPKTDFPDGRIERLDDHIEKMRQAIPRNWKAAALKCCDRLDNITDTAGLNDEDERRLFEETETHFLPLFRWARELIPQEFRRTFNGWILEIEFHCDNYWRRQALRNS